METKMKKLVAVIFLTITIGLSTLGCSVNAKKMDDEYVKDFVSNLQYGQDPKTGLCFAIISSRKTGSTSSSGIGITEVPCERVKNHLVK